MEEWKWIDGYEGEYQVSTKGNIKSFKKYKEGIILKPKKDGKDKYLMICLSNNGSQKYYLIHRLVAKAFIQNPNNYPQVNHKNENRYDNRVENLEWCTPKYNANYGTRNKRAGEKHRIPCKLEIKQKLGHTVVAYKDNIFVGEYYSINECSRVLGLDRHCITYVLQGKYSQTKGYIIKYK